MTLHTGALFVILRGMIHLKFIVVFLPHLETARK